MRLGASIAFAFNSLAQGPVTRKSCWRRESNPGPRDSRPDALATLPSRFAMAEWLTARGALTFITARKALTNAEKTKNRNY